MALLLIGGACVMLRRVRVPHRLVVLGSMAVLGSGAEPTIADFSAGFEQPRYQVGALYGQEGWRPEFRNENGAATVQNALGNSGQAIQSTASPMFVPNTNVVRSRQTSLLTVTGFSRRLMTASVDLFIPEAWTEPAANGADYGYSTGIVLNWGPSTTSPGGGAGITGNVQSVFSGNPSGFEGWSTSNNFVQQSLPTDEWFNLAIQVDFELGQITSFLDGTPISSFAAPEVILPSDGLGVLELRHGRTVFNDVTATPASASVFFDNASVVGSGSFPGVEPIPAPGALLLATLGLGLLGCCKRRLG